MVHRALAEGAIRNAARVNCVQMIVLLVFARSRANSARGLVDSIENN